ncbi:MAG: response regulator [Motiliproteus sp.]
MKQSKVLVVDDAAFIREMVRRTLLAKFPDMQIEDAVNGRKAQLLLKANDYDLILCDWEMPEMSGIELLNWVRQQQSSQVPFVMVTSRGDKANVVEAIQAGVSDYIGKPFSSEGLQAKVIKVLGKRQQQPASQSAGSVSALTGSNPLLSPAKAPAKAPIAVARKATAAKPVSTQTSKPGPSKGDAQLRFGSHIIPCKIKALSLKQLVLTCSVDAGLPALFESVVVDLEQNSGASTEVARINAFVRGLQANESRIDCELVSVTVDIVDQDPSKLTYLSRMIAAGSTHQGYIPGA